jgi:hypothetical protein
VVAALAAALISMVQRALSTPARFVRRRTTRAAVEFDPGLPGWDTSALLRTWELPLQLLGWAVVVLSIALLLTHI